MQNFLKEEEDEQLIQIMVKIESSNETEQTKFQTGVGKRVGREGDGASINASVAPAVQGTPLPCPSAWRSPLASERSILLPSSLPLQLGEEED